MAGDERTREVSRTTLEKVHRLSIAVARGHDAGKLVECEVGHVASVGTAADNDLVLNDDAVSRYHLELAVGPDGIAVRDLGSTNGTFAGNVRVRDAVVPFARRRRPNRNRVRGTAPVLCRTRRSNS